jgi:hypothetical protein
VWGGGSSWSCLTQTVLHGAQTKRPETRHPGTKRPDGKNIRRDKTSGGTKHPVVQNIRRDKTSSRGQNIQRHNIHGTKRPWGHNIRRHIGRLGYIFNVLSRQYLLKNLLSVEEKSANPMHSFCSCQRGLFYFRSLFKVIMRFFFLHLYTEINLEAIQLKYCF